MRSTATFEVREPKTCLWSIWSCVWHRWLHEWCQVWLHGMTYAAARNCLRWRHPPWFASFQAYVSLSFLFTRYLPLPQRYLERDRHLSTTTAYRPRWPCHCFPWWWLLAQAKLRFEFCCHRRHPNHPTIYCGEYCIGCWHLMLRLGGRECARSAWAHYQLWVSISYPWPAHTLGSQLDKHYFLIYRIDPSLSKSVPMRSTLHEIQNIPQCWRAHHLSTIHKISSRDPIHLIVN